MKNLRLSSMNSVRGAHDKPYSQVAVVAARRQYWAALSLLVTITLVIGCARQYHWYDCGCGCVNYNYCRPAPLPYRPYCSCPTPVSSSYHRLLQAEPQNLDVMPENAPVLEDTAP